MFEPQNDEIVGNGRLLQVGEKVKGQIPSRKKPYVVRLPATLLPSAPTGEKSPSGLTIGALAKSSKMKCAVLTRTPRPIHTRLPLESVFGLLPPI